MGGRQVSSRAIRAESLQLVANRPVRRASGRKPAISLTSRGHSAMLNVQV
jgi:hypothetical protein